MVFKKFLDSMEKGMGFGFGLLIMAALAFGVYAFVEPGSGPSTDFYYNTDSSILSNNTITFVGYTGTLGGGFGGIKGGNEACDAVYEGSRWMGYEDFLRISHLYNYTYQVWIHGAHEGGASRDGNVADYPGSFFNDLHLCDAWLENGSGYRGTTLETSGLSFYDTCDQTKRLACIRGQ